MMSFILEIESGQILILAGKHKRQHMTQPSKHDTDFYTWTQEQAALLQAGRLSEIDVKNLIEEVQDMGASEERELESRLIQLIMHLLKYKFQPEKRQTGFSWKYSIDNQRLKIKKRLKKNPGLKPLLKIHNSESLEFFSDCYECAVKEAKNETSLDIFPSGCPFTLEQILDDGFYPGEEGQNECNLEQ